MICCDGLAKQSRWLCGERGKRRCAHDGADFALLLRDRLQPCQTRRFCLLALTKTWRLRRWRPLGLYRIGIFKQGTGLRELLRRRMGADCGRGGRRQCHPGSRDRVDVGTR